MVSTSYDDSSKAMHQAQATANCKDKHSLYPGHRVLAMFPFFNEANKIVQMAERLHDGIVDKFIGVNDGSTDAGPDILRRRGIEVIDQPHVGAGACIKRAVKYAQDNGYDILVVMAGNNKDDPEEIPKLLVPIIEEGADYVQGSRFLPGGTSPNLPLFRLVAIKLLSFLFRIYSRRPCTDLTNGFRAYRIGLFHDPRINIFQDWLDQYEYEYYVHWKVYALRYNTKEVPVTKAYPADKGISYTKIRPITGWWQMLRPFVLLTLRIKK
jgi:dolichol-phosphate mannosyltransferase